MLTHGPSAVVYAVCDRVVDGYLSVMELARGGRRRGRDLGVLRPAHQRLGPDLHPQARDRRGPARGAPAARADAALRHRRRARASTRTPRRSSATSLDHLTRVAETVDGLDQLLSTAFDAHLAQISVQQNEDMRKISAGVGLVAAPTLIAGVYGMNFDHMPELRWHYGYPFALALMVAERRLRSGSFFKRSGWL